jgi:hypothetical protein
MKTLFLAWQATQAGADGAMPSRAWYPIGRLEAIPGEAKYRFAYTHGAERARTEAGFGYLEAFPKTDRVYEASELFPLFQNRVLNPRRSDYAEYVQRLALDPRNADPLEILAVSGGERQTDHLEVFPKIRARRDGRFVCRFFLHGWRHVNAEAQTRLLRLEPGEELRVALEMNNPATGAAVQLQTADDYFVIGWTPRYLVTDFLHALAEAPRHVSARVVQINREPAPTNQRALIELQGVLPAGIEPMSSRDYQPLAHH